MVKRTTQADTFRYALHVFVQQMLQHQLTPTNDQIVRLGLAVDDAVQFSIDQSETVIFIFSDGSRAVIYPETTH
jgi:hypothetical protein